jgi:DNA-binding NtrC family response regulator
VPPDSPAEGKSASRNDIFRPGTFASADSGVTDLSKRSTRPRTILVVDDNRDAADTTAILVQEMGLDALPAYSAREGLDYLDERPDVCLVISDIRMPGVDGFDFIRVVNHRFPKMPTLLTTGLPITEDDVIPRGASILQKPFAIDDLRRAMSERLDLSADSRPDAD